MFTTNELASSVPYVMGLGSGAAICAVAISVYRLLASDPSPFTKSLGGVIIAASTFIYYLILWICCTILDPKTNHLWAISLLYLVNGLGPAAFLTLTKGKAPNTTITERIDENTNDT